MGQLSRLALAPALVDLAACGDPVANTVPAPTVQGTRAEGGFRTGASVIQYENEAGQLVCLRLPGS